MSFTNRLYSIVPSFGVPLLSDTNYLNANVALSGASQQTTTIPNTSTFAPTITRGYIRVKIYNGTGTAPTLTDLVVTVTDGTTTVYIYVAHPNTAFPLSTTSWFDVTIPFCVDINVNTVTVKTTLGVPGGATMDLEVSGTSGTS